MARAIYIRRTDLVVLLRDEFGCACSATDLAVASRRGPEALAHTLLDNGCDADESCVAAAALTGRSGAVVSVCFLRTTK